MVCIKFLSTRPHGARRGGYRRHRGSSRVSIHAPAWGATGRYAGVRLRLSSFYPRARMGRDAGTRNTTRPLSLFLSTRPHGARLLPVVGHLSAALVSIHAPAWGATIQIGATSPALTRFYPRARMGRDTRDPSGRTGRRSFYPRARMGRDVCPALELDGNVLFLSTRPHGARPSIARRASSISTCFYPRARMGRDPSVGDKFWVLCGVSIHAPAWGATTAR